MNLSAIIARFVAIETDLEITEPYPTKINRVYPLLGPAGNKALELPCIMHQYRRTAARRAVGVRLDDYMIRVQLLVAPIGAETDIKSEIAAAFDEALIEAFDADVMLGNTTAFQRITEEQDYQPGIVDWNGVGYVGVQYEYRVSANVLASFG